MLALALQPRNSDALHYVYVARLQNLMLAHASTDRALAQRAYCAYCYRWLAVLRDQPEVQKGEKPTPEKRKLLSEFGARRKALKVKCEELGQSKAMAAFLSSSKVQNPSHVRKKLQQRISPIGVSIAP